MRVLESEFDPRLCCEHQWVTQAPARVDGEACHLQKCEVPGCSATCQRSVGAGRIVEYDLGVKLDAGDGGERKPRRREDRGGRPRPDAGLWRFDEAS